MTSRRGFLCSAALALPAAKLVLAEPPVSLPPLEEFSYGEVTLAPGLPQTQFEHTQSVLLSLNNDSLLKPWRLRAGLPAPGPNLGGWYDDFAPGHSFGQWISALSRGYAVNRDSRTRAKIQELLALYRPAISGRFYTNFRFPAYDYDKMVIGLLDAHRFVDLPDALQLLNLTTDAAEPHLPPTALDRDEVQRRWRASIGENTSNDYTWDESYTLPENLFLAWENGGGDRYRQLANRFLLDRTYFDPLSEGRDVLAHHHAYSFCNALSSAMQAYLAEGSIKHLRAATNAFNMLTTNQSFAPGGWGPDEAFVEPDSDQLYESLSKTHHSFETPCGSYAHFKLTRYLLRVTRDGQYGDSMERVLYNTVLGAKQLQPDGRAFYYSDYHSSGNKVYFPDAWPCCSGTLPQVAADYHVLTYLRDRDGLYVNLYLPSTLRYTAPDGAQVSITQSGNYPFEGRVHFAVAARRPSDFTIRLRIPSFATTGVTLRVNGAPMDTTPTNGFVSIRRRWAGGDKIDLDLPLPMRLEPINPKHPNTVALLRGPVVLYAMTDTPPAVTRLQLLAAGQVPNRPEWRASTSGQPLTLRPFIAIQDERYLTYLNVT